jgi:MFS transporter, FHS family, glucose/mannose:H+ symporter
MVGHPSNGSGIRAVPLLLCAVALCLAATLWLIRATRIPPAHHDDRDIQA